MTSNTLVILGLGYSAQYIANKAAAEGFKVVGTTRTAEKQHTLKDRGHKALIFDGETVSTGLTAALKSASHVLCSAAPGVTGSGCSVLTAVEPYFGERLSWLGYLSTIGVYGNQDGDWVDEETAPAPTSPRTERRIEAEAAWLEAGQARGLPVALFRLGGIYGPGRSPLDKIRAGTSRRIIKEGQVFNRIHVADIANAVCTAAQAGLSGTFNGADDEPAPPQDVITYASELLGVEPPPEIPFESAELSGMARSFYGDNKRIKNDKIKALIGGKMAFPTYREGLASLLADEKATAR